MSDLVNHVALVVDNSHSMFASRLEKKVVEVVDGQVQYLAALSKEHDQETRVSVLIFSDDLVWAVWDKDVLRMPSIKGLYKDGGWTRLIDATLEGIKELKTIPVQHGDHAFLMYVVTDGQENRSRSTASMLRSEIEHLPGGGWTLAAFVPDQGARHSAIGYGFPEGNVAVWEATKAGLDNVQATIIAATGGFFRGRASGTRSSRNLFTPDTSNVTAQTVVRTLRRLEPAHYSIHECVDGAHEIATFVENRTGRVYDRGQSYYRLAKPETIQPQKELILVHKNTGTAHHGREVRELLKLPEHDIRVAPTAAPDYDIYVQSTSVNRKVRAGDRVLVRR